MIDLRDEILYQLEQLQSSDSPRETLRLITTSLADGPGTREIWSRLMALPPGRTPEREGREPSRGR
ncbi:MAG: hypothetical protein OXN89_12295 [Bryobacterales bacterium]|nr:hypothetical protein [Bryobacterales bacterium]